MQVNRLFEIVYLLMEHGCLTAKQLAEKFGVCPRTIYRDIDTLSSAGIPVYANKGKGGGIRLLGEFLLDKTLLTRKEQDEILAALQSLQATHAGESSGVLNRLSSMFARQSEPWIDVDFSHWGADDAQKEIFSILKTGILQRQMVLFVYAGANGETTARSVYPVRLCFKNASWYLQGFCTEKNAFRTFKVGRMEQVELTGKRLENPLPPTPPLEVAGGQWGEPVKVQLWISAAMAFRVYDEFARQHISRQPDGSFLAEVVYPNEDWLISYLLSFGTNAKVISPAWLSQKLAGIAQNIFKMYKPV